MPIARPTSGHRAPLVWLLLPFMLGLVLGKLLPNPSPPVPLVVASLALLTLAIATSNRSRLLWSLTVGAAMLLLGTGYYEWRRARLAEWDDWPVREAEVTIRVDRLFAGATTADRSSGLGRVMRAAPHLRALEGQVLAFSARVPADAGPPFRGARVVLVGVLEPLPRRPPDDGFVGYLVDAGVNFRLSRGRVVAVAEEGGWYARSRDTLRARAHRSLGAGLEAHPSLAAALRGMLLGDRGGLSAEQEELFLRTGTMHLFAISGLHIGVIATGIITLLRATRLSPLAQFLIGGGILWAYVDLTGAMPSAMRAWLMVMCLHAALVARAPGNLLSALAASALLVLLIDPMQLFGAGFQMSYGIVSALLLYGVPMAERWSASTPLWTDRPAVNLRFWHRAARWFWHRLQAAVAIGVAATLIGTTSGVAFFGLFTPVSLFANLPLIPLASLAIFGGFASLVSGLAGVEPLSVLFNHAAALVLVLMQHIVEGMARIPGASAPAEFRARWFGEMALLIQLATMMWGYATGWRRPRDFGWPVVVTLALFLIGLQFVG